MGPDAPTTAALAARSEDGASGPCFVPKRMTPKATALLFSWGRKSTYVGAFEIAYISKLAIGPAAWISTNCTRGTGTGGSGSYVLPASCPPAPELGAVTTAMLGANGATDTTSPAANTLVYAANNQTIVTGSTVLRATNGSTITGGQLEVFEIHVLAAGGIVHDVLVVRATTAAAS